MWKGESWLLCSVCMMDVWLFLAVSWVCLRFKIVVFSDHSHLLSLTLLLKKLNHYKLSDKTINWFTSYLLDKTQKIVINNIE